MERLRRRVHEILTSHGPHDGLGRVVNGLLLLLIGANVVANVVETDREIAARAPGFFASFEAVSVAVFAVEYVLRLWAATVDPRFAHPVWGRVRFALRPTSLVDLMVIAPYYVYLLLPGSVDLRFLRAVRLLRIARLFRSERLRAVFATLGRVLHAKRTELAVTLVLVTLAVLVSAGAIYLVEHREPGTPFTSIPRAMWWAVVTITTVGYGDMAPATPLGQLIGGVVAFVGICAIALPVGILSSGYVEEVNRARTAESHRCPHCGGALS